MDSKSPIRTVVIIALLAASACLRTELNAPALAPELLSLANTNTKKIVLSVSSPAEQPLGYQYLLGFVPFGAIHLPHTQQFLLRVFFEQLTLRGFTSLLSLPAEPNAALPRLSVSVTELKLSAFDLLFTRRVRCRVTLKGQWNRPNGEMARAWESSVSKERYRSMPFEAELEGLLRETLTESAQEILSKLIPP